MKTYALSLLTLLILLFLTACSEDPPEPSVSLDETAQTLKVGDRVEVVVSITDVDHAQKLTIEKTRGGVVVSTETLEDSLLAEIIVYQDFVEFEDTKSTLVYQFKVYSENSGNVADQIDLVITIEISPELILLEYDWQLISAVIESSGDEDIRDFQKDDLMRFHADHNFDQDYGAIVGGFDGYNQNCGWVYDANVDGDTLRYSWYTQTPKLDGRDHRVLELSRNAMVIKYTVDLTLWGYGIETYTETYIPLNQTDDFVPYRGLPAPENTECIPSEIYNF
jgi:hypothetical protein